MKGTAVKIRVKAQAEEKVSAAAEVSRAGIYTAGIASLLVVTWSLACFAGGIAASGGPVSLLGNWVNAVAGF